MAQSIPHGEDFAELLGRLLAQSHTSVRRLAHLSGISRRTLENWSNGAVRAPRHWEPVLHVGRALHLSAAELDALLAAAGQPSLAALQRTPHSPPVATLLSAWPANAPAQPDRSPKTTPGIFSLPVPATRFIGRERELTALAALLARPDVHQVTIAGPGGIGKTRLAQEAARRAAADFADGVHFIALDALASPDALVDRLMAGFGIRHDPSIPPETLILNHLRDRQALLIFDTFENLLDSAGFVGELALTAHRSKVLVTSRTVLHLYGEHVFPLGRLPSGPKTIDPAAAGGYEAVNLFVTRVRFGRPEFELSADNVADIQAICALMDGLPLALELAAARSRALSLPELRRQLGADLSLLAGGPRDAPPRQRSIHDTLAWSFALLTPEQQSLFQRLSVFGDSFSLAAAQAVAPRPLLTDDRFVDTLEGLIDQSLVQYQRVGGQRMYRLHDLARRFGAQQLAAAGEADMAMSRLLQFLGGVSERLNHHFRGAERPYWLDQLDPEINHIWAVLEWGTLSQEPDVLAECLSLCGTMLQYWNLRGLIDPARRWTERTLQAAQDANLDPAHSVSALCTASSLALIQADRPACAEYAQEALLISRDSGNLYGVSYALHLLGLAAFFGGELDEAQSAWEIALPITEELGNPSLIARALDDLGNLSSRRGDFEQARAIHQREQVISQAAGDDYSEFYAVMNLGEVSIMLNRLQDAQHWNQRALKLARSMGDVRGLSHILVVQARLLHQLDQLDDAKALLQESLANAWQSRNLDIVLTALEQLVILGQALPADDQVQILSMIERERGGGAAIAYPEDVAAMASRAADLRQQLDPAAYADAWDRGQALSWEAAVALGQTGAATPSP